MADITECPVCFEEYKDPKLLPCNHTLCLKCLENLEKDAHVMCPMCSKKHKVPDREVKAFMKNPHVVQLIAYSQELEERLTTQEKLNQVTGAISQATIQESLPAELLKTLDFKQDQAKSQNDNELKDNSRKEAETLIAAQNINGADAMVTTHQQHRKHEMDKPSVRPKEKRDYTPAEVLEHSRRVLVAIECEYDPKLCSNCNKTDEELRENTPKSCTKCKTARYCSQKCRATDWKRRHKKHCDEMHKLRTIIQHKYYRNMFSSHEVEQLITMLDGEPYPVQGQGIVCYMSLHDDKQLIQYVQEDVLGAAVYNTSTGSKERVICQRHKMSAQAYDGEFIQMNNSLYIAIALLDSQNTYSIEFWPYPDPADEPVYIYTSKDAHFGLMNSFENNLYIISGADQTVDEWEATSFPIKPTGCVIPTGDPKRASVCDICLMKSNNEKLLLVLYEPKMRRNESFSLKCLDFTGHVLWVRHLSFKQVSMCTDNRGHVFILDQTKIKFS